MSEAVFKPMLSGKFDPAVQKYPILASSKLDGIRCMAMAGKPMSRSMKGLPNRHMQEQFWAHRDILEGLDGEIIVGAANADDVFRSTTSHVMSDDKVFDFTYHVFDRTDMMASGFKTRFDYLNAREGMYPAWVKVVPHLLITNPAQLEQYEMEMLDQGFEGVMIRSLTGLYKQGRATTKSGDLLKVKRFEQDEAVVVGWEEEQANMNEAKTNEVGRTARSSHQANKIGKGTLGKLLVRGINGRFNGVEFSIGTGFDAAERAGLWERQEGLMGKVVTYKHFPIGFKDSPRHPVFVGFRDPMDFDAPFSGLKTTSPEVRTDGYGAWA